MPNPTPKDAGSQLPDPLVPPEIDLREFSWMKLDVVRLRNSTLALSCSAAGIGGAFMLWTGAWHQLPAGSLPDSDRAHARMAHVDRDEWEAGLREEAMHGWILCSDGRWHHPVVAEMALDAWNEKRAKRAQTKKARSTALKSRNSPASDPVTEPVTDPVTEGTGDRRPRT